VAAAGGKVVGRKGEGGRRCAGGARLRKSPPPPPPPRRLFRGVFRGVLKGDDPGVFVLKGDPTGDSRGEIGGDSQKLYHHTSRVDGEGVGRR
jgi:hypothetical protein